MTLLNFQGLIYSNFTDFSLQRASQKRKPTSPLSNKRSLSTNSLGNLFYNRIDAKTYTNVTSNGLTTRLVRYGGNNASPEEPDAKYKSIRTSYTKRSPFPLLSRKPELKNPPLRSNSLSSVRIAPPEKLVFQPVSRSTIFRSGSAVMLPIQSKRDDEPLPPSDTEPVTAQSALEKLKETTRKRINNEELDAERIKKQCKEVTDIDGPSPNVVVAYKPAAALKRGRELYGTNQIISPTEMDAQKKRFKTKYNEITGSLSSSLSLQTPKRRPLDTNVVPNGLDLNAKPVAMSESPTRTVENQPEAPKSLEKEPQSPNITSVATSVIKKAVSASPVVTLFNKKFDTVHKTRSDVIGDDDDNAVKIQFVKPKKDSIISSNGIDPLRRVEPNKLKLLLSCLSGALDEDDNDAVDSTKTVKAIETVKVDLTKTTSQPAVSEPSTFTSFCIFPLSTAPVSSVTPTTIQSKPLITSASSAFAIVSNTSSSTTLPTVTFGTKPIVSTSESIKPTGFTFGSTATSKSEDTDKNKSETVTFGASSSVATVPSVPKPEANVFGNTVPTSSSGVTASVTFGTPTSSASSTANGK